MRLIWICDCPKNLAISRKMIPAQFKKTTYVLLIMYSANHMYFEVIKNIYCNFHYFINFCTAENANVN